MTPLTGHTKAPAKPACKGRHRGTLRRLMAAGVRAGRPNGGSGGLEAYAFPFVGIVLMVMFVSRFGPKVAQRISRFLVGEETPLEFSSKGKLQKKATHARRSYAKAWA